MPPPLDPILLATGFFAPVLFWIGYLYYKDRCQPEPLWAMGVTYLLGIGSGWLCLQAYELVPLFGLPDDPIGVAHAGGLEALAYLLGVVGVLEEVAKFLPFLLVLRLSAFDEPIDGFLYSGCLALGFATYENFFYLPFMEGFEQYGRAFASPLAHVMMSSVWGYAVGTAWLQNRSIVRPAVVSVALAAVVHGLYDFLTFDPVLRLGSAGIILGVWIWWLVRTRNLHQRCEVDPASPGPE